MSACLLHTHTFTESVLPCQFVFWRKRKKRHFRCSCCPFLLIYYFKEIKQANMEALGNHFWAKWWGKALFSFTPWRPICFCVLTDWISAFIIASDLLEARRRLILLLPSGGGSLESLDTNGACSKTWLCNSAGTLAKRPVAFLWGVYLRLTKSNMDSMSS